MHWEKEVIVVDTMHSDHGMVWSGSSLKPWADKLPNNSIVACVIQGEGARFSAQLMDALVPVITEFLTGLSRQTNLWPEHNYKIVLDWSFLVYRGYHPF